MSEQNRSLAPGDEQLTVPYLGFGVAGIGTGLLVQAPGLLLLIYMTDTLGIPAALAGLALFAPRIFDAVTDPIMGVISDRTRTRWGRRRPYLLVGAIVTGIAGCFLFAAPLYDSVYARLAFVMAVYILMVTGATVFMVPWMAMPAEMTTDYHRRTRLMSSRSFFVLLGLLVGGVLAPLVVLEAGGGRAGYAVMSVAFGVICGGALLAAFFGTRKAAFVLRDDNPVSLREQARIVVRNRPFRIFIVSWGLFATGMGCAASVLPYAVRYILEKPDLLPTLWGMSTIVSILAIPLWTTVARRLQKHRCFGIGLGLIALASGCFFFLHSQAPLPLVYATFAILGLGFSAALVAGYAMLPDVIQWDAIQTGGEHGGIYSGAMIAFDKCGFALGSLVVGTVLGWAGYIESTAGDVVQPASALLGIKLVIGGVPAVLMLGGAVAIMAYPLTERVLREGRLESEGLAGAFVSTDRQD